VFASPRIATSFPRIAIVKTRFAFLLLSLVSSAHVSFADLITGRVVDANGVGVAGIDINAFRVSNGNEEGNLSNDGTDATGNFSTTIPSGVYDLQFIPPAPPTTTHVPLVLRNVVVSGTKALGTLHLAAGVSVSAHLQTQSGSPVGQVRIDVFDETTGFFVPEVQLKSNAFGNFAVAVPKSPISLRLVTTGIATPVLASQELALNLTVNTNLGNITLKNGFVVSGHVQNAVSGVAASNVDLDFLDAASGLKLFTPNDTTDTLGNFSTIVPAGDYNIEFCAPTAFHLVGLSLPRTVSSTLNLGTVGLQPGFVLSGTIRSSAGVPQVNADVDVRFQGGNKIVTCNDNSNGSGVYSVIVPSGTLKILFHPASNTLGLGSSVEKNVLVSGNLALDGTLPIVPPPTNYGAGLAGTGGIVPHLTVSGGVASVYNGNFAFELQNGRGGANGFLMLGLAQASTPILGGTLLVAPNSSFRIPVVLGGTAGAAGAGSKHFPTPILSALVGIEIFGQFFVSDPAASQGWAFSDGLRFRVSL
jgi:hypothetical protein